MSAIVALTLTVTPSAAYGYGSDRSLWIKIQCGVGYSTEYEAYNTVYSWIGGTESDSAIWARNGSAPKGDIGVQAALFGVNSNGSTWCMNSSPWLYNASVLPQNHVLSITIYGSAAPNHQVFGWGNPAVWRSWWGGPFVYKTDQTPRV